MEGRKKENFVSTFAITAPPLLRKAKSEQIRQILQALTAVRTYAASEMLWQKCFLRLCRERKLSLSVLSGSGFLLRTLTKKTVLAETALPKVCFDDEKSVSALLRNSAREIVPG